MLILDTRDDRHHRLLLGDLALRRRQTRQVLLPQGHRRLLPFHLDHHRHPRMEDHRRLLRMALLHLQVLHELHALLEPRLLHLLKGHLLHHLPLKGRRRRHHLLPRDLQDLPGLRDPLGHLDRRLLRRRLLQVHPVLLDLQDRLHHPLLRHHLRLPRRRRRQLLSEGPRTTVFVTVTPAPVTVTAALVLPTPAPDLRNDGGPRRLQPTTPDLGLNQSFIVISSEAIFGFLAGIVATWLLIVAGLAIWRKAKRRARRKLDEFQ
ncbi:hypothetical protein RB213_007856 [Colletotrichum asianum]